VLHRCIRYEYLAKFDIVCAHVGVRGNADEDALLTELFDTRAYNHLSRPVSNLSESIQVQLGLVLQKIVQVVCESCNYISGILYTAVVLRQCT